MVGRIGERKRVKGLGADGCLRQIDISQDNAAETQLGMMGMGVN